MVKEGLKGGGNLGQARQCKGLSAITKVEVKASGVCAH